MGFGTIRFLLKHPLSSRSKFASFQRLMAWQVSSKILGLPVVTDFVNGSRLLIGRGMTGATGNFYAGLHEFEDMSFVLHALRSDDLFVDVGANIGSYTVLAGAAVGARCVAVEPLLSTFKHLLDNVNLNDIRSHVECLNIGISGESGVLSFSLTEDTMNHVLAEQENADQSVSVVVKTLDDVLEGRQPLVIKIDVEGWETGVVAGARHILSGSNPLAVVMELNGSSARYGFDENDLHTRMLNYGFETMRYEGFQRELISLNRQKNENGNTLYVRGMDYFVKRLKSAPQYQVFGLSI